MYDTIKFSIPNIELSDLENVIEIKDNSSRKTGEINSYGLHKNFVFRNDRFRKGVIVDGSLAKFYFNGSNLETLNRQKTNEAIEKLSDELKLNISENGVYRIDIATNLIMDQQIKLYFTCLGELNYFVKSNFKDSLYYERKNLGIQLNFYDKLQDLKKKQIPLPDHMKQYNNRVLRYELRIMKSVSKNYNKKNVKIKDLSEETFYNEGLNIWKDHYFSIEKLNKIRFQSMAFKNLKTLQNQMMLIGLNAYGSSKFMNMIELSKGQISRNQYYRAKKKVRTIMNSKELTEPNDLIFELDKKIIEAVIHQSN